MATIALSAVLSLGVFAQAGRKDDPLGGRPDGERLFAFLHTVQQVLRANDAKKLSGLVNYPLRANLNGRMALIHNQAEFLTEYPHIFTPARKGEILSAHDSEVWCRDQGCSLSDGVIWFDTRLPAGAKWLSESDPRFWSAGRIEIITVNAARKEAK